MQIPASFLLILGETTLFHCWWGFSSLLLTLASCILQKNIDFLFCVFKTSKVSVSSQYPQYFWTALHSLLHPHYSQVARQCLLCPECAQFSQLTSSTLQGRHLLYSSTRGKSYRRSQHQASVLNAPIPRPYISWPLTWTLTHQLILSSVVNASWPTVSEHSLFQLTLRAEPGPFVPTLASILHCILPVTISSQGL